MKANLSRMWRSGIAMLLAICMIVGFVPAVAFATEEPAEKPIYYVSLGDSTTNGYGLTGYEFEEDGLLDWVESTYAGYDGEKSVENPNGLLMETPGAYPAKFRDYLATATGREVNLIQLAVSAMRADDVLQLLTYGTDDYYKLDDYSGNKSNDKYVVHNKFLDDYKLPFEWNYDLNDTLGSMAELYQNSVKAADVVSINLGSNNFSIYLWGFLGPMIMDMMGMGDGSSDYEPALDELIKTVDSELVPVARGVYDKVKTMMMSKLAPVLPAEDLAASCERIADCAAYTFLSYCVSYTRIMDRVNELNQNADIILMPMVNFMKDFSIDLGDGQIIDMSDYVSYMLNAANTYVSSMAAVKTENGGLTNKVFYADHGGKVDMLMAEMPKLAETNFEGAEVLHSRLISSLTGWIKDLSVGAFDLNAVRPITRNDVKAYKTKSFVIGSEPDGYHAANVGAYVGIETALISAAQKDAVSAEFFMDIMSGALMADMTDLFTDVGDTVTDLATEAFTTYNFDKLYEIGNAVAALMDGNETAQGMLYVMAYFMVADGVVCHPSESGYTTIANAMEKAYEEEITVKDEALDNINWALGELQKIIAEYGPDMAQSVWQQWIDAGYVGAIDTLIDELWTELQADHEYYKNAVPEINKAVQAMMTEQNRLIDELNALNKQLTDKKAELADVIAKQEISDVTLPNIKIEVDLGNNTQTEVYEHECVVEGEGIEAELKAAIADLEHAIAVVEALIADITADIEDMVALAEQIAAAAAEFEKTFADIQKAAKDLENAFNAIKDVLAKDADKTEAQISAAYTAARKTALAAISVLDTAMGVASDMSGDIEELLGKIEDAAEALQGEVMGDLEDALDIKYLSDTEKGILYVTAMVALPLLEEYKDDLKAELTNLVNAKKDEYTKLIQAEKDKWLLHIQEKNGELLLKKDEMVKYIKDEYAIQEQKIRDEYENVIKPELIQKRDELTLDLQAKQDQMEQYLKDLAEATDDAVKAEIQAAIDLLQPQIDRVSKDLATVNADLECMTEHLDAALAEAYDKVSAEAEKLYGEAIDALDKAIVELNDAMNKAVQELTDAMNKAVKELEDAFNKQIAALDAAIKAQIAALELEQKKAEFLKKIADAEQAVKDLLAKIDNEIKTKVAEAEDKIRDEYNAAMAELLKQKAALEAELKAAQKALADAADAAKAEIEKQIDEIEDEIARVEKEIADAAAKLEADLKEAHDKIVKEVNDAYAQTLAELEKAVDDLKKAMAKEIAELEKELDELIASLDGEVKDLLAELKNKVADSFNDILDNFKFDLDLGVNLDGINDALNALKDALVDAGIDSLESLGNILSKLFQDMLYAATHADLTIDNDFKYLALGDGSAASKSYAEDLAEMLQAEATENGIKKPITFVNHAEVGKTVAEEAADLCDEVASADLITLGYSQTEMMEKALKVIVEDQDIDWTGLVGKEAAVYIEEALEKVFAELDAVELPEMIAPYIKAIVEAYAYGAVEYAVKMPALLLAIREVNKDAVVINVGMYNPLADVVIDGMDMSQFNEYFNYLIDGVAVYGIGLAMLTNQIDYVDARDVAVAQPELKSTTLLAQLMGKDGLKALYPSEEGDDYIANQIAKALNLSFTGLLGDVNDDGKVLANDAMLVLQYSVGQIKADKLNLSVADVTGDGKILANDAMEILQYSVGARTRFSCEK